MFGPAADVQAIYQAVGGQPFDQQAGFFTFPCNSVPAIAFNWGGEDWAVSAENFSLGETEKGSGQCVGALASQDLGLGKDVWLLGDSFMKNVYTAFSFDDSAVGFAKLA
jgi:cathepsin D